VDPITLAGAVTSILAPLVAKGAKVFVKEAGQVACDKAQGLLDRLKQHFGDDQEASTAITSFEGNPVRYRPVVEDILQSKLSNDDAFASQIAALVEEMGPTLEVIQRMDRAEGVVGVKARELKSGRVKVDQKFKQGTNIVGADIDKLG